MNQKVTSNVIKYEFIGYNPKSRPMTKLTDVRKLIVHYTANPGASARNHKSYFANLKDRSASAHIFVDKYEAICIIPLNEVAYHAGDVQKHNADGSAYRGVKELLPSANYLSIGVELCIEKDGSFHPNTLKRAQQVFADLCKAFKLDPIKDIVRHYDHTAKYCPAPFIKDVDAYNDFKKDIKNIVTPKAKEPTKEKSTAKSYVVVEGDTFYKISSKTGISVEDLQKFNPRVDSTKLHVGDVIYLYLVPSSAVEKKPKPKPAKKKVTLPSGVYNKGDKGTAVKQIQDALNDLNFKCGKADGVFGQATEDALERFQKVYLPHDIDGVYGAKSKAKMEQLLNK